MGTTVIQGGIDVQSEETGPFQLTAVHGPNANLQMVGLEHVFSVPCRTRTTSARKEVDLLGATTRTRATPADFDLVFLELGTEFRGCINVVVLSTPTCSHHRAHAARLFGLSHACSENVRVLRQPD